MGGNQPTRLSETEVGRLLSSVAQEQLALSNAPRKPRSRAFSRISSAFTRISSAISSVAGDGPKDMGDWLGLLKVKVVQGDQLLSYATGEGVISYDKSAANPVCFLSWGTLRAMSGCVKQNISPEWNEEFLFDVFQGNLTQKHRKKRHEAGYLESIIRKEEEKEAAENMAEQSKYVKILEKMRAAEIYHPPKPPWLRAGTIVGAETQNTESRMDFYWPVIEDDPKGGLLRVEVIHQGIDNEEHKHLGYAEIAVGESIKRNDSSLQTSTARLESSSEEWGVCGTIVISHQFEPAKRCENLRQKADPGLGNWWKKQPHSKPVLRSRAHTPSSPEARPRSQLGASPSPNQQLTRSSQPESLSIKGTENESDLVTVKEVCVRVRGWDRTRTRPIRLNHQTGIQGHTTPNTNRKAIAEKIRLNRLLRYYLDKCQKDLAFRTLGTLEQMGGELEEETKQCIVRNESLWAAGGLWTDEAGLWESRARRKSALNLKCSPSASASESSPTTVPHSRRVSIGSVSGGSPTGAPHSRRVSVRSVSVVSISSDGSPQLSPLRVVLEDDPSHPPFTLAEENHDVGHGGGDSEGAARSETQAPRRDGPHQQQRDSDAPGLRPAVKGGPEATASAAVSADPLADYTV